MTSIVPSARRLVVSFIAAACVLVALPFFFVGSARQQPLDASAANGRIAYTSGDGALFTVKPDGTGSARITNSTFPENTPSWSPDGTRIAFGRRSQSNQNDDVWIVNSDGSNEHLLISNATQPAWSPDGQKIAFIRFVNGNFDIFVANASDGSSVTNLTNSSALELDPAWSPDSTKIAFTSNRDAQPPPADPNFAQKIYIMNADGGGVHRLTSEPVGTGLEASPAWSPDGARIAYGHREGTSNFEVFAANADGSNPTNLTNNSSSDFDPSWSPDGTRIVFATFRDAGHDNNIELYVMDANGGFPTRVTNNSVPDMWPSWGIASAAPTPTPTATPTPAPTPTPLPPFNINGRVTDSANNGVANVTIILITDHNGSHSTLTAADGSYALKYTADSRITIAPAKDGLSFNPSTVSFVSSGSVTGDKTQNFTALPFGAPNTFQFSAANYDVSEAAPTVTVTVTRSGSGVFTGGALVNYRTVDDPAAVPCSTMGTTAYARCDYATSIDTLYFAAGETEKSFTVSLVNDGYVENPETFGVELFAPVGATLGAQSNATVTIADNDTAATPNPVFDSRFFVRQQYLDFLTREPDSAGFAAWVGTLDNCAGVDPSCDRVSVSSGFFRSTEFQAKGFFVFKFYKVAFGRLPTYAEIVADMRGVTGASTDEVQAKRDAFTDAFARRQEFKNSYDSLSNQQFVDALLNRYGFQQVTIHTTSTNGIPLTFTVERVGFVNGLNNGTYTRAQVLRMIAESDEVTAAEFNSAFVAMQYYGYLRRTPETGGYNDWLRTINANPADIRSMVSGFVNSPEYKGRFGQP